MKSNTNKDDQKPTFVVNTTSNKLNFRSHNFSPKKTENKTIIKVKKIVKLDFRFSIADQA